MRVSDKPPAVEGPKPTPFPLDQYLSSGQNIMKNLEAGDLAKFHWQTRIQKDNLLKKINDLTYEANSKAKPDILQEVTNKSPIVSSSSLNESESGYTEHLVETKFNEVTFNKYKPRIPGEPFENETVNEMKVNSVQVAYSPKNYEEIVWQRQKTFEIQKEKPPALLNHLPQNRNPSRYDLSDIDSLPSRLNSSKISVPSCQCLKKTKPPLSRNPGNIQKQDESLKNNERNKDRKIEPYNPISRENIDVKQSTKLYNDASVNTELPKKPNTSLLKIFSHNEMRTTDKTQKMCEIQELPIVNIRPNLTKQIGPVIDIRVPKQSIKKCNVAVIEYIHPDIMEENKALHKTIDSNFNNKSRMNRVSSSAINIQKKSSELKLQRSIKEFMKKLNFKKGPNIDNLKKSLALLLEMLTQITPFHKASIRLPDENFPIVDESIDLFFTNVDIVTEVVESELKNPIDKFCIYPECIIKAINLLCGNIRSIFNVRENQQTSVKSSIKRSDVDIKQRELSEARSHKGASMAANVQTKSCLDTSYSSSEFNKDGINIPKDVYIPYRKLIPGGKYKEMEEATNIKEVELRRKRLEKIHQINQQLRSKLPSNQSPSLSDKDNVASKQNILNRTFIIERADEDSIEKISDITGTEGLKKAENDYEDDWEQDPGSSHSTSGETGSLGIMNMEVEAQVHSNEAENIRKQNIPTDDSTHDESHAESSTVTRKYGYSRKKNEETNERETQTTFMNTGIQTEQELGDEAYSITSGDFKNEGISKEVKMSNHFSFPVLRMTNPITNTLLEVRLPEQTEHFQSSLLFQKSENKEEIKLSYNSKRQEVAQLNETKILVGNKEHDIISSEVEIKGNEERTKISEDQRDFENITTNFIGFLENKVSEMVNKFKSSETAYENLCTIKVNDLQDNKSSTYSFHNKHCNSLNPGMKCNISTYKSASSLGSEKSTEELRFLKNSVSRGCSSLEGRKTFEDLKSPPLALVLKNDMLCQTDVVHSSKTMIDACVGTSFTLAGAEVAQNEIYNGVNENLTKLNLKENEMKPISVDKNLSLCTISFQNLSHELSHSRLLPLPGDVLKENNFGNNSDIDSKISHSETTVLPLNSDNEQSVNNNGQTTKEIRPLTDHIIKNQTTEDKQNSCEIKRVENYKGLFNQFQGNNSDNESDSQETLQILNMLSTSFTDNNQLQSPSKIVQEPKRVSENTLKQLESTTGESFNASNPSQIIEDLFQNKDIERLHPLPPVPLPRRQIINDSFDWNTFNQNKKEKESVHSLYITESANQNIVLSSCGNMSVIKNTLLETEALTQSSDLIPSTSYPGVSKNEHHNRLGHSQLLSCPSEGLVLKEASLDISENIALNADHNNIEQNHTSGTKELIDDSENSRQSGGNKELIVMKHYREVNNLSTTDANNFSSDEQITVYYYNSDDMSEGEIGFVYTSNSYSSGEIKPSKAINLNKKFSSQKKIHSDVDDDNISSSNNSLNDLHDKSLNNSDNNECEEKIHKEALQPEVPQQSSNDSMSTGELQKILSTDDKLDEGILNKLVDIHLRCSTRLSSDSTDSLIETDTSISQEVKRK